MLFLLNIDSETIILLFSLLISVCSDVERKLTGNLFLKQKRKYCCFCGANITKIIVCKHTFMFGHAFLVYSYSKAITFFYIIFRPTHPKNFKNILCFEESNWSGLKINSTFVNPFNLWQFISISILFTCLLQSVTFGNEN